MLGTTGTGVFFGLVAALFLAGWIVLMQRGLERGGGARLAIFTMSVSFLGLTVPWLLWEHWRAVLPPLTPLALFWFLAAGMATTGVGPVFIAAATRRIGAARTASIRLLDAFFAFAIGALFLGERLSGRAMVGVALIIGALALLQMDRPTSGTAATGTGLGSGVAFAVTASFIYAAGSILRKAALLLLPSAAMGGAGEGVAGILVTLPVLALAREGEGLGSAFQRRYLDFWLSGICAAIGAVSLNVAMEHLAVPVAVALRNTSPWFALILVPLLLGRQQRPGPWTWVSTGVLTAGMLFIVLR